MSLSAAAGALQPLELATHRPCYTTVDTEGYAPQKNRSLLRAVLSGLVIAAVSLVLLTVYPNSTTQSFAEPLWTTASASTLPALNAAPAPRGLHYPQESASPTANRLRRRDALIMAPTAAAGAFGLFRPRAALAAPPPIPGSLSWITENVQSTDFDEENYGSMRDDEDRTGKFYEAINKRLQGKAGKMVVVDVGTGPYALLAIAAARAGAKKVYAIEATPAIAVLARANIEKAGIKPGVIEVLEGYSTEVTLPEKADLLVGEIIGSVASEESVFSTIRDAQARFMKEPNSPKSYIPQRVQTLMAPVSWPYHYMVAAEGREAAGLAAGEGPIRLNCRDESIALMADAQLLEDFEYSSPDLPQGAWQATPLSFTVSPKRIQENTRSYFTALGFEGQEGKEVANSVAQSYSGLAMWPRLILDESDPNLVVDARGPRGAPQKSHWQTVLALMADKPLPLKAGDVIDVQGSAEFGPPLSPTAYTITSQVQKQ